MRDSRESARNDNGGNSDSGGDDFSQIRTVVRDDKVLEQIQQRLSDAGCTDVSYTRTAPDGGLETVVEARCNADVARQVLNFILETNKPRDAGIGSNEPVPKPNSTLEKIEKRLERGETIADIVLNPPDDFGAKSRDLAARLAETIEKYQFVGKTIVAGVVAILAADHPADTLATQGYDLEPVAEALAGLPIICRGQMRQMIQLELAHQPSVFPHKEEQFWEQLDAALK